LIAEHISRINSAKTIRRTCEQFALIANPPLGPVVLLTQLSVVPPSVENVQFAPLRNHQNRLRSVRDSKTVEGAVLRLG